MHTSTMKAIQVHQYGGPETLQFEQEVQRPEPAAGEVLVRIQYAGAIPLDWKIRNGWLQDMFVKKLPYTPGTAMSGIVESVGDGVETFQPGDRVFGNVTGSYAEYGIAPAQDLVHMPNGLSFEDAATIKGGAEAAWKALFTEGELEAGQTVLIHAAAGGVGQYAVQLAKWKGAHVIATASGDNVDFVASLGADQVIDYKTSLFEEQVSNVDLVVESVGGEIEDRSWGVLKRGGKLVSLTQLPSAEKAEQHGVTAKFNTKFPTSEDLNIIAQLMAEGSLRPEIDSIFPLSAANQAHAKSEARHGRGRILLDVRSV
ncbi:MAG TPA: NADP-dependent oxidoreductase [Paenibacillus sp.]|uniref:NADP-dependent oxidoreductase n=1 Tax=Paenibacillus TaxID=44249 RepID=UPI000BA0210C|nr:MULTISPECIES: NADP-dependent oxidoreductase [Paenibacillus]OZQ65238.1 alcohol dehydrogenase [Paenibacillus taichungensis]HBU83899.1 NADP-dependent oxidoreductase [Paenibacillus sp.]